MSDVAEGIGGAIEGALAGRAVEPKSGEGAEGIDTYETVACFNCGAVHTSLYCPQCGQKRHVHRTLSAIFHDLIHGVLHLDGKFWLTLPLLVFKPGKLTRRYIDGERAKFVSPMAMFLFSVFAMFAVFQMVGLTTPTTLDVANSAETIRKQGEAHAADMRAQIAALPDGNPRRQELEEELAVIEGFLNQTGLREGSVSAGAADEVENTNGEVAIDLLDLEVDANITGIKTLDEGIIKKWKENPGLMLYKLQANGYKFSWLLIPLSIPFVWLTFAWRRGFKAYDHAVFVTYSLSFMSLLFICVSLVAVSPIGAGWAFTIFATAAPLHVYKHLKHTYGLSRFSAIWRFLALFVFINIILVLFVQALLLLGAF